MKLSAPVAAACAVAAFTCSLVPAAGAAPLTWEHDPAVEAQVQQLVGQMTTAEKADLATGQLNNFYGFYNNGNERLGIPASGMADGPVGVRIANPTINQNSTQFPSATSMAATFNPSLVKQIGATIGNEAFHTGHNVQLAPSVDVSRTPLWGRAFEGYGEDPFLSGTLGGQFVLGIQSNPVLATIKHYAVYDQETNRFTVNASLDERTLQEIYNKPFDMARQIGHPGAAMCAFNKVNGTYACENPLMNTVLKAQSEFRGFVMSDYNATPSTAGAANAGLDQEQPGDQGPGSANFGDRLVAAVDAGQVSVARLNDMASRILRPMIGLGLFDNPVQTDRFDEEAHAAVSRKTATQGMVLLRNLEKTLPLKNGPQLKKLAVIGPDADNISAQGGGSSTVSHPTGGVSPLEGLTERAGDGVEVTYSPGTDGINEGDMLPGPAPVPSSVLTPEPGSSDAGLHAQYWGNTTFSGDPEIDQTDPNVNVNFGFQNFPGFNVASPKAAQSQAVNGQFSLLGDLSARWTGQLKAPVTGYYTLGLTARGNATLWLDGEELVQHSGPLSSPGQLVLLTGGESHDVRIEYSAEAASSYQGGEVRFFWQHAETALPPAMHEAVVAARAADAAVVVVRDYETEGYDRADLELPKEQAMLIRQVADVNPRTIVVIETGAPTKTSTWTEDVRGVIQAWYPGQEQGTAIADVVFGDVNPSGRMPATVPRDESQVPAITNSLTQPHDLWVGYRGLQQRGQDPTYPFGYGLSYTTFQYSGLALNNGLPSQPQGKVGVSFFVRNVGVRSGTAVPQVYVGQFPGVTSPKRQLAGFTRVALGPGQSKWVTVSVPKRSLQYWNTTTHSWTTATGRVPIYVSVSANDAKLSGAITVRP